MVKNNMTDSKKENEKTVPKPKESQLKDKAIPKRPVGRIILEDVKPKIQL